MRKQERADFILERLQALYPETPIPLAHRDPFTLLIAVLLSAQCTDERVNQVTRGLFQKYRTAADYAGSPPGELEEDIRSTGFFNSRFCIAPMFFAEIFTNVECVPHADATISRFAC